MPIPAASSSRETGESSWTAACCKVIGCTRPSAISSPAVWQTASADIASSWHACCKVVRPSTRVNKRQRSGVNGSCGFRSRNDETSTGIKTVSGRRPDVSTIIGGRGVEIGCGGVKDEAFCVSWSQKRFNDDTVATGEGKDVTAVCDTAPPTG